MSSGHPVAAAGNESAPTTCAYGLQQHQRELHDLEDGDERSVGWHCVEHCRTGMQAQQHAPEQTNQHGPAETSYVTAAATDSENTVEMEATRKSPTRDLYPPVRPPTMPGYMAATQSARAKARMAPPAAPRTGVPRGEWLDVSTLGLEQEPQRWQRLR